MAFARALPAIRRQVDRDLARPGLPREKVLAAVVRLLELTLIRVGNDEYRRLNRSFGLTTLRDRHATVSGTSIRFRFKGKSGRQHEVGLRDRRLATVIQRCQDLPGQDLFQYEGEDGEPVDIASDDVNDVPAVDRAGRHGQGLPDVGRDGPRVPRAAGARRARDGDRGEAERRRRDPRHRGPAREHRRGVPSVVRPPGRRRGVPGPAAAGRLLGAAEATGAAGRDDAAEERAVVRLLERRLGKRRGAGGLGGRPDSLRRISCHKSLWATQQGSGPAPDLGCRSGVAPRRPASIGPFRAQESL